MWIFLGMYDAVYGRIIVPLQDIASAAFQEAQKQQSKKKTKWALGIQGLCETILHGIGVYSIGLRYSNIVAFLSLC